MVEQVTYKLPVGQYKFTSHRLCPGRGFESHLPHKKGLLKLTSTGNKRFESALEVCLLPS